MTHKMCKEEVHRDKYQFRGEGIGRPLAEWLNGPVADPRTWLRERTPRFGNFISLNPKQDSKARGRITRLLDLLRDLTSRWEFIRKRIKRAMTDADRANLRDLLNASQQANRMLRRYVLRPQISVNEPYWERAEQPTWLFGDSPFVWGFERATVPPQEQWAIRAVETLSRRGLLGRLKRCDICKRFFFATKNFQVYCGQDCRAKRYQSKHYKKWRKNGATD
jgi:hypothetical protein